MVTRVATGAVRVGYHYHKLNSLQRVLYLHQIQVHNILSTSQIPFQALRRPPADLLGPVNTYPDIF